MANGHKFDPKRIERLKNPDRLRYMNPEVIWDLIAPAQPETLIDVGTGVGFYAIPFSRKMPEGRVYACDLLEEMLEHLRKELEADPAPNVIPVKTEEVAIPLPDGIGDAVLMVNLHHELDHPEESLEEARRLLRKGGILAIVDWKPAETPEGPPLERRVPQATVRAQLERSGFRDIREHPELPNHYAITARS